MVFLYKSGRRLIKKIVWCYFRVGAKGGTFSTKAHLHLDTIFKFVSYWLALKPKQKCLEDELNIAPDTVVNWFNFCLVDNSEKLGCNRVIFEIDECNFACDKLRGEKEIN